ncbi:hypothetical protein J4402_02240 [Candidatus Pacearchaeota archaeon]|nr:hypothetical protein [Candidatus Pacearchaeota archaeon]
MKKQVIVLAFVLVILFSLVIFVDWRNSNAISELPVLDNASGFFAGALIVAVVGILILIAFEKSFN